MSDRIGPTFAAELAAANPTGEGCAWFANGTLVFPDGTSPEFIAYANSVLSAHDPEQASLPAPTSITFKADIWRRASDEEAETLDKLIADQPVRLRNMYRDAQQLNHNDELFPVLLGSLTDAFGVNRAAQLLAPS